MTETSIEELLRYDDEPARARRGGRSAFGWWVGTVLAAAALTAVAVFGLRTIGLTASVPVVFAGSVALLLLRRLADLVTAAPPTRAQRHRSSVGDDGGYLWGGVDALTTAVRRWNRRLDWADDERGRFAQAVHPKLCELVDERLRLRHGCTRASDPARARELLGEPVWRFLSTPPTRTPRPRDCAAILAELEKI